MARSKAADSKTRVSTTSSSGTTNSMTNPSAGTPRRRSNLRELHEFRSASAANGELAVPKVINAAPSLEKAEMYGIDNERPASSKIMALFGRMFMETIPQLMVVAAMLSLIFGGCCSNVFALEAIIKPNPSAGTLLTCVQFIFIATTGYFSQFDSSRPPFFLRPNKVPLKRWIVNIALFFTINVLNNHAFSYNISVPIHIILRSGGSITTIAAGYLWGKRFSRLQVISVLILTAGVIIAAWSDSQTKPIPDTKQGLPPFSIGLLVLFIAQILSAGMGLYTEETYREYGPHWRENLFYSHSLSLPLFLPFVPQMYQQLRQLAASPPLVFPFASSVPLEGLPSGFQSTLQNIHIPSQLAYLVLNVLTQYACIRGVNLLAANASALTVTIVLNVRKLISLLLSIYIFGHQLSPGTLVGAIIVFGAGGMYSLDGGKGIGRPRRRHSSVANAGAGAKIERQG